MHNSPYSVNIACFCSKNFIKSLEELKSFFSFEFDKLEGDIESSINDKYGAVIIELAAKQKISLSNINIPRIFVSNNIKKLEKKNPFEITFRLPLNVVKFNQDIIDICKKYEFNKNSLIKIKDYILDKNERILKKANRSLKITEKEINFIDALNSSRKPLSKDYILKNIWSYSSDTDTHTIETHIYRLRQKIKKIFDDNDFIKNTEDGYTI